MERTIRRRLHDLKIDMEIVGHDFVKHGLYRTEGSVMWRPMWAIRSARLIH